MAHVTIFRIKAKPGEREAVIDTFDTWQREHMPKAEGFVRSTIICNWDDDDEFMAEVMFESKETYEAMSSDPEQGKWFEILRSHLIADPDWFNGKLERESGNIVP